MACSFCELRQQPLAHGLRHDAHVAWQPPGPNGSRKPHVPAVRDEVELQRVISNLVENARRYGRTCKCPSMCI